MDVFDGYYYKSCKWFLELSGLWPYQSRTRSFSSHLIFIVINATLGVPQLLLLVQKWGKDITVTFENTVSVMFTIGCIAKYSVTYVSLQRMKLLFVQIARDWQTITDKAELEILKRETAEGRFLVYFYTIYIFMAWVLYTLMPFLPWAMDIVMPLNETRPILMPFYADYVLFDQVDYHYWTCCHIAAVYLTAFFLFSGIDTTYVISVKHTCGLFAIICHRLEHLSEYEENEVPPKLIANKSIDMNINHAVTLHAETIKCCELLEDSFSTCFLMVNCMSVITFALAGVYVLMVFNDLFKLIRIVAFVVGLVIHIYYLNWVGQQIINYSEEVFNSAYSSKWYFTTPNARLAINIILARSLTPCRLTAGKITILSMESFGILMKTSASYFTVFLSVT